MKYNGPSLWLSCLLSVVSLSVQRSIVESDHYIAAVVEHSRSAFTNVNLAAYISYIAAAASQGVDIIVFPESTLTRNEAVSVDITESGQPAPCDDAANQAGVLVKISCAARQYSMYVVVNLQEQMDCTESEDEEECPEKKNYRFNANVVFDRNGNIIDKYRKINLFDEDSLTPSLDRALGVFSTDFGVTFGHFICFDLLFQVPAVQVVRELGITHIVYPTRWFSETPFLTAVQIQEGYARALNVTLLAASANNVTRGSGGSGIYSGSKGALIARMPGENDSGMLIAKVPKVPGQVTEIYEGLIANEPVTMDGFHLNKNLHIPSYTSQLIEVRDTLQILNVTDGEVNCNFELITNTGRSSNADHQKYYYRVMAFDGVRSFKDIIFGGLRVCAILACTTQALESCGSRFSTHSSTDTTLFNRLSITAMITTSTRDAMPDTENIVYYPVSLQNNILPLTAEQLTYSVTRDEENKTRIGMVLKDPNVELLTLGVWGRAFERDWMDNSQMAGNQFFDMETVARPRPDGLLFFGNHSVRLHGLVKMTFEENILNEALAHPVV